MTGKTVIIKGDDMSDRLDSLIKAALEELAERCAPDEEACVRLYKRIFADKGGEGNG